MRAGALGDLLLLRPALASLRAASFHVGLLAPAPGDVLLGNGPGQAQERLAFDGPGFARLLAGGDESDVASEAAEVVRRLRSYSAAIAVTSSPDLVATLRRHLPEVKVTAPFPRASHASAAPLEEARALGGAPFDSLPLLVPRPEDLEAGRSLLEGLPPRFLALHPGSGSPGKNWPAERFVALAERRVRGAPFLVVEGPADIGAAAAFRGLSNVRFARGLPLRALGALLGRAGLYVGNDSGVTHLAAAFGAPTLALFGPTDAAVWSPLGPRVRVVQAPEGRLEALDLHAVERASDLASL